ncbi:exported hypothetical protein [Verrucomicrobia bacterium]|nr:exported hypothetical protein [Verrucomicrobiota bacterium]
MKRQLNLREKIRTPRFWVLMLISVALGIALGSIPYFLSTPEPTLQDLPGK